MDVTGLLLRRRELMMGKTESGVPMYHPNKTMIKCRTTSANQSVNIFGAGAWSRAYNNIILDDVSIGNASGGIVVPNAGDHTIYFDVPYFNYGSIDSCVYYIRLPNKSVNKGFLYGVVGGVISIDILYSNPPSFVANDNRGDFLQKANIIRIPIGTKQNFVSNTYWAAYTDKIIETEFILIDD